MSARRSRPVLRLQMRSLRVPCLWTLSRCRCNDHSQSWSESSSRGSSTDVCQLQVRMRPSYWEQLSRLSRRTMLFKSKSKGCMRSMKADWVCLMRILNWKSNPNYRGDSNNLIAPKFSQSLKSQSPVDTWQRENLFKPQFFPLLSPVIAGLSLRSPS